MDSIDGFKEFKHKDRKKILQYIALMYDIRTPMIDEKGDYWERKKYCANIVDLPKKKSGEFEDYIDDILLMQNEEITALVILFCTSFANIDYMQIVFSWEMLIKVMKESFLSTSTDKNHVDIVRKIKDDINENTRKVFMTGTYDELAEARKMLYKSADLRRLNIRPEDIAYELKKGNVFNEFCPYEDGYEVQKISFVGDSEVSAKKKTDAKKKKK
jgi:hypothetical protein